MNRCIASMLCHALKRLRASWFYYLSCNLACLSLLSITSVTHAEISVTDDSGIHIRLPSAARRIISLAPHTTELLFTAGAGSSVIAITMWSDFPPQVKTIPSIGSATDLDIERIVSLQPDLIVAWKNGNKPRQIAQLRRLGFQVYESEPRTFDEIAISIEKLAMLAGTEKYGTSQAHEFRKNMQALQRQHAHDAVVSVFYQIWQKPLMTLNGQHLISQALKICGGLNIFSHLSQLAPTVNIENVIQKNPEVIFLSSEEQDAILSWQRFPTISAVQQKNIFIINGSIMNRAGPRMLDATQELCDKLDTARQRRQH